MSAFNERNEHCLPILLTVRAGVKSGSTLVYCACEWRKTYPTRIGAERGTRAHLRLTDGLPAQTYGGSL